MGMLQSSKLQKLTRLEAVTVQKNKGVGGRPINGNRLHKNAPIVNPLTGLPIFGMFPSIAQKDVAFEGGPIYMRYGQHHGFKRGWGFEHIWQARYPEICVFDEALPVVTGLVTKILVGGASIHYEYGLGSADRRSTVFRSSAGVVIVEERMDGQNKAFYSIVTAYPGQKANGPKIGAI